MEVDIVELSSQSVPLGSEIEVMELETKPKEEGKDAANASMIVSASKHAVELAPDLVNPDDGNSDIRIDTLTETIVKQPIIGSTQQDPKQKQNRNNDPNEESHQTLLEQPTLGISTTMEEPQARPLESGPTNVTATKTHRSMTIAGDTAGVTSLAASKTKPRTSSENQTASESIRTYTTDERAERRKSLLSWYTDKSPTRSQGSSPLTSRKVDFCALASSTTTKSELDLAAAAIDVTTVASRTGVDDDDDDGNVDNSDNTTRANHIPSITVTQSLSFSTSASTNMVDGDDNDDNDAYNDDGSSNGGHTPTRLLTPTSEASSDGTDVYDSTNDYDDDDVDDDLNTNALHESGDDNNTASSKTNRNNNNNDTNNNNNRDNDDGDDDDSNNTVEDASNISRRQSTSISQEWVPMWVLVEYERVLLVVLKYGMTLNKENVQSIAVGLAAAVFVLGIVRFLVILMYVFFAMLGLLLGAVWVGTPVYNRVAFVNLGLPRRGLSDSVINNTVAGPTLPKLDQRLTGAQIIDDEINSFVDVLLRDFVHIWFDEITTHTACPIEIRQVLQHIVVALSNQCKQVDWIHLLTDNLVKEFTQHLHLYRAAKVESEAQDETKGVRKKEKKDKDKDYKEKFNATSTTLEWHFFELGKAGKKKGLAQICQDPAKEAAYCRNISEVLCYLVLPTKVFDERVTRTFIRELIAISMLQTSADTLSMPDYVNQTIALMIDNDMLTFSALKDCVPYCTPEELAAISENIDLDIAERLGDNVEENAQKNKKVIDALLTMQSVANSARVTIKKTVLEGVTLMGVLTDEVAVEAFRASLGSKRPLLSFWEDVREYRSSTQDDHDVETLTRFASEDRVTVEGHGLGTIKYLGVSRVTEDPLIGVELDTVAAAGHTGTVDGHVYFECEDGHGLLVKPRSVRPLKVANDNARQDSTRRKQAQSLHDTYLLDATVNHIKLPEEIIKKIRLFLSNPRYRVHRTLFNEAQDHIFRHLDLVCFDEFRKTPEYEKCVEHLEKAVADHKDVPIADSDFVQEHLSPGGRWRAIMAKAHMKGDRDKVYTAYDIDVVYTNANGDRFEWKTERRYSEFDSFQKLLKETFQKEVQAVGLSLPTKKLFGNMSKDFIEKRGKKLIEWLKVLTSSEFVSQSLFLERTVAAFLMKGAYAKEATKKKLKKQNDSTKIDADETTPIAPPSPTDDGDVGDSNDELLMPIKILLQVFDEIFELQKNQWTRRGVTMILVRILKGLYGDKMNHMIADSINVALEPNQVADHVKRQREESWWPDGNLLEAIPDRSEASMNRTKVEARAKLFALIPEELKRLIGSKSLKNGTNEIFEMLQNHTLNKRLFYVVLELVIEKIFPGHFEKMLNRVHASVNEQRTPTPTPTLTTTATTTPATTTTATTTTSATTTTTRATPTATTTSATPTTTTEMPPTISSTTATAPRKGLPPSSALIRPSATIATKTTIPTPTSSAPAPTPIPTTTTTPVDSKRRSVSLPTPTPASTSTSISTRTAVGATRSRSKSGAPPPVQTARVRANVGTTPKARTTTSGPPHRHPSPHVEPQVVVHRPRANSGAPPKARANTGDGSSTAVDPPVETRRPRSNSGAPPKARANTGDGSSTAVDPPIETVGPTVVARRPRSNSKARTNSDDGTSTAVEPPIETRRPRSNSGVTPNARANTGDDFSAVAEPPVEMRRSRSNSRATPPPIPLVGTMPLVGTTRSRSNSGAPPPPPS